MTHIFLNSTLMKMAEDRVTAIGNLINHPLLEEIVKQYNEHYDVDINDEILRTETTVTSILINETADGVLLSEDEMESIHHLLSTIQRIEETIEYIESLPIEEPSKKVVVINGPILSGKDSLVDKLVEIFPSSKKMEMKTKLIELTIAIHGVSMEWWEENYTREGKEIPRVELDMMSMREALIHTSEVVIKPNYGREYFGLMSRMLVEECDMEWYFYADGGFPEELIPLGEGTKPMVIRIHREGCEYDEETDSRSYIQNHEIPSNWIIHDVVNVEGEFDQFVDDVCDLILTMYHT